MTSESGSGRNQRAVTDGLRTLDPNRFHPATKGISRLFVMAYAEASRMPKRVIAGTLKS